jgi:ubiquinone/menaquinone biosynthesis C-methylase UbiE
MYERLLVAPLFRPFAHALLDLVDIARNDRLLDVACGTGIVARLAREMVGEGGRVTGVDASGGMIAVAKATAPNIEWHQGDAARLPFHENGVFDVVTCHQGLQFFADKPAATREMRRVLAPRGRVALATWRRLDDNPLMLDLHRVAVRHLGPVVDLRHSFGDPDVMRRLLADAGFQDIRIASVTRTVRMTDGAAFAWLNAMAIVAMSPAAKTMTEEERSEVTGAIANDSVEAARSYFDGSDLVFDLVSNVAIGRA